MPVPFEEYAESHGLDSDTYPFAKAGLKTRKFFNRAIVVLLILFALDLVMGFILQQAIAEADGGANVFILDYDVGNCALNILTIISAITDACVWLLVIAVVILLVTYLVLVVLRWRSYERDVITCDGLSIRLKNAIVRTMRIDSRIHELRSRVKGKSDAQLSMDDEAKVAALQRIKRMEVYVNDRQSLDDDSIERQYRIIMTAPFDAEENSAMMAYLKDFERTATRMAKGKVSFGSQIVSADYQVIKYYDAVVIPDKHAWEEVVGDDELSETYEYTYPLSLFIDHTKENAKRAKLANRWSQAVAEDVDSILATLNVGAKRTSVTVGTNNVSLKYELSFSLTSGEAAERLENQFNKRFGQNTSTVDYMGNAMDIVIGLPDNCTSMIDVKSLLTQAFGKPADAA